MARRRLPVCVAVIAVLGIVGNGLLATWSPAGAAGTPAPVISGLTATPSTVKTAGGFATISASVANATTCTITASPALLAGSGSFSCTGGSLVTSVVFPTNRSTTVVSYSVTVAATGSGGTTSQAVAVKIDPGDGGRIAGVRSIASTGSSECALLRSGAVDCWGDGEFGDLGNGQFYVSAPYGSALPVHVEGVSGTGLLSGVSSLTSDGDAFCALLTAGGVDCWGYGVDGDLGNGQTYSLPPFGAATPVQVEGVGGTGLLSGVSSLTSDGTGDFCALLTTGAVDCWGYDGFGNLANGSFSNSATPLEAEGVGGTGVLSGVASLTGDASGLASPAGGGYCALLTSGGVDCWGGGASGELGNGQLYGTGGLPDASPTPVQVVGVGGTGTLSGVARLASDAAGFCALLTSSGVDCWGGGEYGELGNGQFYQTFHDGSATPVQVLGAGGTGLLSGVTSLTGELSDVTLGNGEGYCALLASGGVDCWGYGYHGELGDGQFYSTLSGSAIPVQVEGVGGTAALSGVSSVASDVGGYCALLTLGEIDCWGLGKYGELGNGASYASSPNGSDTPVPVESLRKTGVLSGASSLAIYGGGYTNCALVASGRVDCWGLGENGQLGNGKFYSTTAYGSRVPVQVG